MDGIAIIGMSGRFPGAGSVSALWDNLARGVESISRFSDAELEMRPPSDEPHFVNARGIVEGADLFDAPFFNVGAREAELLDPQHRVLLECAWEALESAGYDPEKYPGLIGVWAGSGINSYLLYNIATGHDYLTKLVGGYQQGESAAQFSNDRDFLATRIAYKLNLKGPSLTVQTACSTSLVAVAQACQALWSYQTDMALAGGVSITFPQRRGYVYQEGAIASADGHTRTFDAAAQGTVFSSGAGIVLLKRLEDALEDGDPVIAVIKGAAINNDGAGKVSFTAPSVDGQAEVIRMAQALGGIEPQTISYVEAHGTGTPLGDPIEVAALTQAFRAGGAEGKNFCALGSLKTNVGHMDIASGVAGLIKASLALQHRKLPATLHFTSPNPHLGLPDSPFYVNKELAEWTAPAPLRAAVSSFGVGGANAHAVLEEAPAIRRRETSPRERQLFILSAQTESALDGATTNFVRHLRANPSLVAADVAFTLQQGRRAFSCRRMVAARDLADAAEALESRDAKRVFSQSGPRRNPPVAFLFAGQGAQALDMGATLCRTEPVFRTEFERCAELLRPQLGDLREALRSAEQLNQTRFTQPALFVFGYALAKLWMSWGIEPCAMLGHSVGEYVAACLAGVFSLEDGLRLVAARARLVQAQPGGVMLAVRLPEAELAPLLAESRLSLAALNSPALSVVSGRAEDVAAFERTLEPRRIVSRRLNTSHAFHSAMMDPVVEPFTELVKRVKLNAPSIPFVSNVSGRWITEAEATSPAYWARHLREAVRFADGVGELMTAHPDAILLEVGPGQTLAPMARQHSAAGKSATIISTLQDGKDEGEAAMTALGRLWLDGVEIDWNRLHSGAKPRRVALPTYPFERKRCWIEPPAVSGTALAMQEASPMSSTPPPSAVPMAAPTDRKPAIIAKLRAVLKELSGQDQSGADPDVSFLELGFDSLFLTQVAGAFRKEFNVKVTFRQLLEDYPTMSALAEHLEAQLPAEPVAAPLAAPVLAPALVPPSAPAHVAALPGADSAVERLIQEQLRIMEQQLAALRGGSLSATPAVEASQALALKPGSTATEIPKPAAKAFGPYRPIEKAAGGGMTERQQAALEALIARYVARTPKSKQMTQESRARLADPRTVSSFRRDWKEMVYPIVVERSAGSRFWDVDGNEFIDITMGFGTNLLGHTPPFIAAALQEQVAKGIEVGPQSRLAGKVATLLCELTGSERAAFTNTGSEAVLAAVRLARTVTGRTRIATCGGFHGINDEVLVRGQVVDGQRRGAPVAPGIPQHIVNDVVVADYGTPEGLELLRAHAHELAAVLVEPVQSRKPDLQPREWLHELRRITAEAGCALIFDEVITGFRCALGGAQEYFGVKADLATYGKIMGGGMPIGAVAGKAEYMDALDGGAWQYGDASFPEVGVTFFAGTYIRHPLTMAASWAVLNHIKEEGPELQRTLTARAKAMVGELNAFFEASGVPLHLENFASVFYPRFDDEIKYGSLLYFALRALGIHIWEGRPCFLSTAHSEEDVRAIVQGFKESIRELQAGGFLPGEAVDGPSAPPVPIKVKTSAPIQTVAETALPATGRTVAFSLYFFGNYPAAPDPEKYRMVIEGAKFADQHNFEAVWLPERHFHSVGGFSPNPSLIAAALARETTRLQLRGGSVVLPLHHPVRVAEEWALVDNLSNGRTGISIASGWHPNDFIFAPDRFERRREICLEDVQTIQKLWRGETLSMRAGAGADFGVKLFPAPIQPSLPVWLTCIHEESFIRAGENGMGVLGYLMNQTVEELASKVAKYREALVRAGHDPAKGKVTVLVHTFLGANADAARESARQPLKDYLRSYLDNSQKRLESQTAGEVSVQDDDVDYLLEKSFNDYVRGKALIGSPESCAAVVDRLRDIGVDEIGCFIDFGVNTDQALAALPALDQLRARYAGGDKTMPLTESQSGLWVLGQTDRDALRAYNESTALDFKGSLDVERLRQAVQTVVDRHDALRTTIAPDGETQTVHARVPVEIPLVESPDLPKVYREVEAAEFDFAKGPIFRAQLLRLAPDHHRLITTFHHLLGNGPSYFVFFDEVTAIYDGASLPPPMQLTEFAAWRTAEAEKNLAQDEAFWAGVFPSAPAALELPADRPRPPIRSHRGVRRRLTLSPELTALLRKVAAGRRGSLFMLLLAGFQTLLHRLSGQDDVTVGVPYEGEARSLPGGDHLYANTTNVMPLRSSALETATFANLFDATKKLVLDANDRQNYFFARLIKKLGIAHDPSRPPIFAAFFNYESGKFAKSLAGGALKVEFKTDEGAPYRSPRDTAMFELYLNIAEKDGALLCECDGAADLFDSETIARWLVHYQTLLEAVAAGGAESCVWELPLLSATQRKQLLVDWNRTEKDFPLDIPLHELVDAQMQRTPDRVALAFEGRSMSYAQMRRRADGLAGALRDRGIGRGSLVAVCLERSFEMPIAVLAVMKAGAAYVPLDPEYPAERLAFIIDDIKAGAVLTQERWKDKLPAQAGCPVLALDTFAPEAGEAPEGGASADDPAYVIFTSGSTGQPKGVVNTHRNICNRLHWKQRAFPLVPEDRLMLKTPFTFDVSVPELFAPLMVGAAMIIAAPRGHMESDYLANLVEQQRVSDIHFVPAMLAVFLEEKNLAARCRTVRRVSCTGEALPGELVARFFSIFGPDVELLNLYGPTEAAVEITYYQCRPEDGDATVPIGKPIDNTQCYVVDPRGQPVPIGVPGELLLGGANVALGYLGRPELTAEKFIDDPFTGAGKLYRTADLCRYRADGEIMYLGRMDHQVKVRGFRIELGEIETVLNAHPEVRESVVIVHDDGAGKRRLVAYVVAGGSDNGENRLVGDWHSQWEGMHTQGIIASEAIGGTETPTAALLLGMKLENHGQQVSEFEEQTLALIRSFRPRRVLEVGCGTGNQALVLSRECERYVVTDFSPPAIAYVRAHAPANLVAFEQEAADFSGIDAGGFDTVTMHSVCQYFPSAEYLRRVVTGMVRAAAPGGRVYVGDVQSFALLDALHRGKQVQRAPENLPVSELRERIHRNAAREVELVADAGFFHAMARELPAVRRVECFLRRGHLLNEATRCHYDVILHVGETAPDLVPSRWLDWKADRLDLVALQRKLESARPEEVIAVRAIPNSRLQAEMFAQSELDAAAPPKNAGELRERIAARLRNEPGVDPEDLWGLVASLGWKAAINHSSQSAGADGLCEAIFYRGEGVPIFATPPEKPFSAYANQPYVEAAATAEPATGRVDPAFAGRLRTYLKERLPDYMSPAAYVALARIPTNANGKVDRRALPAPDFSSAAVETAPAAAGATASMRPLEKYLTDLWRQILGIERIGLDDNFFESGGDSLSGVRMVNRLREKLNEHLSLIAVFEAPTIRKLADFLEKNYPESVEKFCGKAPAPVTESSTAKTDRPIGERDVAVMRRIVGRGHPPAIIPAAEKNPRAVFILSPMRSGSTLLRVMLAGNSALFSPPELQLLQFDTLAERRDAYTGYERSITESTIRALMEIHGIELGAAQSMMAERENSGATVRDFYREVQGWLSPRLLVDKTPEYAMDVEVLRRAEAYFEGALYIHLARHPLGMIRSYEKGHFLLESPYRDRHNFNARQMAELTWLISHRNIFEFLSAVPSARRQMIRFEDIVSSPERSMKNLAAFLKIDYQPGMLQPYEGGESKMTNGVHELSVQVGDPYFFQHGEIKADVAEKWKADYQEDFLSAATWEIAAQLGYENPFAKTAPAPAALPTISSVSRESRRMKRSALTEQAL